MKFQAFPKFYDLCLSHRHSSLNDLIANTRRERKEKATLGSCSANFSRVFKIKANLGRLSLRNLIKRQGKCVFCRGNRALKGNKCDWVVVELISQARRRETPQLHHSRCSYSRSMAFSWRLWFCQFLRAPFFGVSKQQCLFKFIYLFKWYSKPVEKRG